MKIALDTNVIVSAIGTRGLCAELFALVLAEHEPIVGETVLAETRRVLRTKFKLDAALVDEAEQHLRRHGTIVPAAAPLPLSIRDPSDIPVLAEAVAGGADILISGDDDLLSVAEQAPIRIESPRQAWQALRGR